MCEGFVNTYQALIGLRFLLGALEAGIFPGILYVTSMYYKRFEYQRRLTAIWSSAILSNAFGGPEMTLHQLGVILLDWKIWIR
ncbi:MFS general substrate transporter [Apiospora hydei]|uniref:MFS general substrate transporter n=1 Tax=Apiospora hydei TaxID=1337664 RepID=A0ABR1WP40_9PEZI